MLRLGGDWLVQPSSASHTTSGRSETRDKTFSEKTGDCGRLAALLRREGARLGGSKESSGSDRESSAHNWVVCRESADLGDFRSPGNCTYGLCFRLRPSRMLTVLPVVLSPVLPLLSQCSFLALLPALAPSPLVYIASYIPIQ